MFTWRGVLDRAAYAWRSGVTIAFLIGTILLFPYLSQAIVMASHCAADTCGAVALVAPTILRPILFIAAMAMALSACVRRARHAGLQPWLGAFPPLMFVGDQALLQYAGAGWAYPFSAGVLSINLPVYALFGTALIGLLGVPSRDALRGHGSSLLDRALLALAALLSIAAVVRAGGLPLFVFTALPLVALAVVMFESYATYAMPLFLALAAYRLWRTDPVALATPSPSPVVVSETPNLWRPGRAALVGPIVAFAVLLWTLLSTSLMPVPMVLMALAANLLLIYVPTFVIYTALVAAVLRFTARRDAIAATALFVALIPFGFWAASLSSVLLAKAHEREATAAIPKVALPAKIDVVVIEGEEGSLINCARRSILSADYGVGDVLTHGRRRQSWGPYLRFTRATANSPVNKGVVADGAPAEYVLVRFPDRPPIFLDRVSVDISSPPVEIYAVGSAGTQLVAASYTALNPPPTFPPMLTTYGWYRGENSTTSEKSCKSVANFLQRELLDKLPPGRT
ncbi:hypothetical protein LUI11_33445 [Bradyrhizobium diazoefficiens]|nr:hypothetical protein [Bradyrhizobium diazoefficiens]APO56882.1 hypothetical protein BD122_41355 [Bradyrhizobium diazoefficiens]MCD9296379.1 hypothetical protein [Bradyrhizobium diazoefficiens]MCD9814927.1 hypothetical protein [Bradyrhizobium diazoefficiens]MCD9833052.1 hypothetical protein [Bradyrhizobium diazoefficiens]MCD9851733.1 hypothetical protein [Bradyrhizobium diazoefficiens]